MRLLVNGEIREPQAANLSDVWEAEARDRDVESPHGFAIALNGRVVPKARWGETPVADGDQIEIIRAMSGG